MKYSQPALLILKPFFQSGLNQYSFEEFSQFIYQGNAHISGPCGPVMDMLGTVQIMPDSSDPAKATLKLPPGEFDIHLDGLDVEGHFTGSGTFTMPFSPQDDDNDGIQDCLSVDLEINTTGHVTSDSISIIGQAIHSQIIDNPADGDEPCDLSDAELPCIQNFEFEGTAI